MKIIKRNSQDKAYIIFESKLKAINHFIDLQLCNCTLCTILSKKWRQDKRGNKLKHILVQLKSNSVCLMNVTRLLAQVNFVHVSECSNQSSIIHLWYVWFKLRQRFVMMVSGHSQCLPYLVCAHRTGKSHQNKAHTTEIRMMIVVKYFLLYVFLFFLLLLLLTHKAMLC